MTRRPRAVLLAALTALLAAVLALAPGGVALAHTSLVSSSPADGEALGGPPAQLVLVFDDPVAQIGAAAVVTGPDGAPVAVADPVVDGTTVTFPLDTAVPAGAHTASWRVAAADGHPIEGSLAYTAAQPEPAPEPAPEPEPAPAPEPSAADTDPAAGSTGPAGPTDPAGGSTTAWLVAVLAAVGAAAAVLARRRRSASGGG